MGIFLIQKKQTKGEAAFFGGVLLPPCGYHGTLQQTGIPKTEGFQVSGSVASLDPEKRMSTRAVTLESRSGVGTRKYGASRGRDRLGKQP